MDIVSGIRAAIQDLLVPELLALQTELRNLGERLDRHEAEDNRRFDQLLALIREEGVRAEERLAAHAEENNRRFDAILQRLDRHEEENSRRFEVVFQRLEVQGQALAAINGKLDVITDLVRDYREVVRLGSRVEVLEREVARLRGDREGR